MLESKVRLGCGGLAFYLALAAAACSVPGQKPVASEAAAPAAEKWTGSAENSSDTRIRPVVGTRGMVVAESADAAAWGSEILRRGGNAVDAAVATAFALAVARPHEASLGGGGFMLYCPAPGKAEGTPAPRCTVIDYREEAPAAATRDMFVKDGKARAALSQDSPLSSGVPGVTAGLLLARDKFGSMPLRKLLSRPIEMARKGIRFTGWEEAGAADRWRAMNGAAKQIFGCGAGRGMIPERPCEAGATIVQRDFARVLEEISRKGNDGFYRGWVGRKLAAGFKAGGGLITEADLAAYRPKLREPIVTHFNGMEVVTMPPPSNGGSAISQMLSYVQLADQRGQLGERYMSARTLHVLAHAMQLAFADRAQFFGDPDYFSVPLARLLSPVYLEERWKTFDPTRANLEVSSGGSTKSEGSHTTHFSVVDRAGNAVAVTTTINDDFGSGFVPPGTGVVMNNEMDDFSAQPGAPNLFGLIGGEANAIVPHKRPVSSMSPTVVRAPNGEVRMILGAAGGPTITSSIFLTLVERLKFDIDLPDAVAMGRIHQQWRPRDLYLDQYLFSDEVRDRLTAMGYSLKDMLLIGRIHGLERFPGGRVWGVADSRAEGAAVPE